MMQEYNTLMIATILLGLALTAVCVGYRTGHRSKSWKLFELNRKRTADEAIDTVILFSEQVGKLRKKRNLLDEHVVDYFNTIQDAGWPHLQQILSKLGQAERQLRDLLDEERYVEAKELAALLLEQTPDCDLERVQARFSEFSTMSGWKKDSEKLMLQLVERLQEAAVETQDVGVSRQRKRQPTLLALSEIRELLVRQRGA